MILATTDVRTRFVTQPDHAALSGRFAEAWGGDGFDPPTPRAAMRLAVHAHDDGWWPRDRRPQLGPDGTPRDFHELSPARWTRLYRRGIDEVARADPYAGLLVSLHGAGLRRQRYGLSPSWPDTPRAFRGFVEREGRRQRSLATALREDDDDDRLSVDDVALLTELRDAGRPPSGFGAGTDRDPRIWRNYRLLGALDALSLRICATPTHDPDVGDSGVGEPGIDDSDVDDSDGDESVGGDPIEVPHVPTEPGRPDAMLTATPLAGNAYRLDPYPFTTSPVSATVPVRTVEGTSFPDEETLFRRYYAADVEEMRVTLRHE